MLKVGDHVLFADPDGYGSSEARHGDRGTVLTVGTGAFSMPSAKIRTIDGREYMVNTTRLKKIDLDWDE